MDHNKKEVDEENKEEEENKEDEEENKEEEEENKEEEEENKEEEEDKKDYIVYVLINDKNNCTYVGITNNSERRIRQHNNIIKGGAKYTTSKKCTWSYHSFILNCNKREALSIEKKIHIYSKKTVAKTPIERRIKCIEKILKDYNEFKLILLG